MPPTAAAQFHPPLDATEGRERAQSFGDRHADVPRRRQCRERVQPVVAAGLREIEPTGGSPAKPDGAVVGDRPLASAIPRLRRAKRSTSVQTPRASTRASASSSPLTTSSPLAGIGAHEVVELRFDRRDVRKDVGVVEFEIVEDRRARPVVDELRALVEERRVVLVGLDHEERTVAVPRGNTEVDGNAADQEARLEASAIEDVRKHRRSRRLAVRARRRRAPTCPRSTCSASHCGPDV